MNDVKKKLVGIVCEALQGECVGHCNHPPCTKVETIADRLIANGVTVQEWIPASEPPKVYRDEYGVPIPFLAYTEDENLFITYLVDGKHWGRFGQDLKVTHWMPLPEPPKGK